MVQHLFTIMERKGLGKAEDYMAQYDGRSENCLRKSSEEWPEDLTFQVKTILSDGLDSALRKWAREIYGVSSEDEETLRAPSEDRQSLRGMGSAGAGLVLDAGAEDPEHPNTRRPGPNIQKELMALLDGWKQQGLKEQMCDGTADHGFFFKRLTDLEHPTTNHSWM